MNWERAGASIIRRRRWVLIGVAVVLVGLAAGLAGLESRTSQDTLVSSRSKAFRDNVRYQERFGGETMIVEFTGDPVALVTGAAGAQVDALENELRATSGVATVVGPMTALRYAAAQLTVAPGMVTAAAARTPDQADAIRAGLVAEAKRLGAAGEQRLDNPAFARFLLFGSDGAVRPAMRTAFPDAAHALLVVRIAGNASIEEQGRVADAVRSIVAAHPIPGVPTLATGSPVLLKEINDYLQGGMATLGLIAVVAMVVVLGVAFGRARFRLLPLGVVIVATAGALGAAVLLGIPLSLVTISGLPIFIGLGVDFAIQVHSRYEEQRHAGDAPDRAAAVAVSRLAPPLLVAMAAAAFGFLALRRSSVPMIKDFGTLLCVGVVVLVATALLVPAALLAAADTREDRQRKPDRPGAVDRVIRRLVTLPAMAVVGLLVAGAAMAGSGFAVERRIGVQTDPERWVSPSGKAVTELEQLREGTGFSSELGLMVEAPDVTADPVVAWMHRFVAAEQQRHAAELKDAASMVEIAADVVTVTPLSSDVQAVLGLAPHDIAASLVAPDRTVANIVFPIAPISLEARGDLLAAIDRDLRTDLAPPAGVTVTPAGLAVIGVELVKGMESNRGGLTLASLGLVSLWLLVRGRGRPRSLLPIVPVAIAVGLATFVVWVLGIETTPLTTVAAPLVIAVATEFAVILEARYAEEREGGATHDEAVDRLPRIGRAFFASGATLVAGFAVMAASPMPLLRDFGIVVAIDVVIALLAVLTLLPPLLRGTDRAPEHVLDLRPAEQAAPADDPFVVAPS